MKIFLILFYCIISVNLFSDDISGKWAYYSAIPLDNEWDIIKGYAEIVMISNKIRIDCYDSNNDSIYTLNGNINSNNILCKIYKHATDDLIYELSGKRLFFYIEKTLRQVIILHNEKEMGGFTLSFTKTDYAKFQNKEENEDSITKELRESGILQMLKNANKYSITGENVNVRFEATTNSEVLVRLNKGDKVQLLERSTNEMTIGGKKGFWTYIDTGLTNKTGDDTIKGWIFDYYLKYVGKE